jgi:hypothetical protein
MVHSWKLHSRGGYMHRGFISIDEAALVAAGHNSDALQFASSIKAKFSDALVRASSPQIDGFSKPILRYAMDLGNYMPQPKKQRLMSFVFRLSGTADTEEVERARREYIWSETCRLIFAPKTTITWGKTTKTKKGNKWKTIYDSVTYDLLEWPALLESEGTLERIPLFTVGYAAGEAARKTFELRSGEPWEIAFGILDRAIKLGRDNPVDAHLGSARLHAARMAA